ncbi:hypothetical protein [Agathobaculum sp.]|uniref:hypothetical protein n=1 Tax=Agathobaculum sp. TaxID=2048138 RepID=UPI002A80F9D7|nr:hypothetical protein [Agathobaculum sp.]MDY3619084.1 hypothetical protein [Agathobaculum sp.]
MELYQDILREILARQRIEISFPDLQGVAPEKLIESASYTALRQIKEILENDTLSDADCFVRIEKIICVFERMGSRIEHRHGF